ncbi:MAG: septum formation initiator family protein [Hyphomonadaceae bacterium]|nr:septum formation initiator family protein [Clostridia bacterium]
MEKRRSKHQTKFILLCTGVIVVLLYASVIVVQQQFTLNNQAKQLSALEEKAKQLEIDMKSIDSQAKMAQSPENKEQLAREKLGLVKPGEKVFIDSSKQ